MWALPGTSGFVGEFLDPDRHLQGQHLGGDAGDASAPSCRPAYALWLYRKVIFGVLDKPSLAAIKDLDYREIITLGPLAALTILFGFFPKPVLDLSAAAVTPAPRQLQPGARRGQDRGAAGALTRSRKDRR